MAINGVTVEVKFSVALDETDAVAPEKVTIDGVTLSNPSLSDDGKTLTYTAGMAVDGGAIDVEDATVVVNPIQTKADKDVSTEKYVTLMTYKDEVAPSIVSVESVTNGEVAETATVKLSEPIKAGASVKVNGDYVTANYTAPSDEIELTGLNIEAGKTHTVEVINAEDVAGNKVVSMSASFTVSVDDVAPVATVSKGGNDKEILLTFNKSMKPATVIGIVVRDEDLDKVNTGAATVVADSDNTQFTIAITDTIYSDEDSRTFSVVIPKDLEDEIGNKTASSVQTVTLTKDTVKPVATGYNVIKDSEGDVEAIEVNFSEGLVEDSVAEESTIHDVASSVVDENGVLDTTTFASFESEKVNAGDKKIVFKAGTAQTITGKYTISFNAGIATDQSESANESNAFSYSIDFGEGEQDTEFELSAAPTATNNVITVTFPEAVKGGAVANSATDIANYTLAGKPLPEDTTITLNVAQTKATITLPEESIAKTDPNAIFTVANIKNTDGTKTVKTYKGTVAVQDNVKPVLESARVLSNDSIELTFSENIAALTKAPVGDEFTIYEGTTAKSLGENDIEANSVSGFNNKLIISVTATTPVAASAEVSGANKDKVALSGTANADSTVEYYVADDAGTLKVYDAADDSVAATLDEQGDGSITLSGVTIAITGAADGDEFTVETAAAYDAAVTLDLDKALSIETKATTAAKQNVKDSAGNAQKEEVKVNVSK